MEKFFVDARRNVDLSSVDFSLLDELPKGSVSLAATVQYLGLLDPVRGYLVSQGREVVIKKGAFRDGHVLGCNSVAFDASCDVLLLVTDGRFHALNNALQLQRPIHVFTTSTLELLSQEDVDRHNAKTLAKQKKFLSARRVGLLYSSKDGQKFTAIDILRERLETSDRRVFVFEAGNLSPHALESFPQIDIWVNTACYGIARDDDKILNVADIIGLLPK